MNEGPPLGGYPPRFEPILTADKLPALNQAVLKKCANFIVGDGNDLIYDARGCNFDARDLICTGANLPTCLTVAQADVVNKIWQGPVPIPKIYQSGFPYPADQLGQGWHACWKSGGQLRRKSQ